MVQKTEKRKFGDLGEDIATRFLKKRGYTVIERNYQKPWGEIDVIVQKNNVLHFVEVKTMRDVPRETIKKFSRETTTSVSHVTNGYRPEENVHEAKLKRLYRAIATYLDDQHVSDETEWVIDVLAIHLNLGTKEARIRFIENIT